MSALQRLTGHAFTIVPHFAFNYRPRPAPESLSWRGEVVDRERGVLPVTGLLRHRDSDTVVVLLHGLGGDTSSSYMQLFARAIDAQGQACLRLNLRGACGTVPDYYHAGLIEDVHAALSSAELAPYSRKLVIGFSLGGHIALRLASQAPVPQGLAAVVAVSSPLDLDRSCHSMDHWRRAVYRRYILQSLGDQYARVSSLLQATPHPGPISPARARRISSLRHWDNLVVAPRHGFDSAEHYYAEASVAPKLSQLALPALYVGADADPMVLPEDVRPALREAPAKLDVRWAHDAGHVGFPATLDLGCGGERGLENQVLAWLARVS